MTIRVQQKDFEVGVELAKISSNKSNIGGICCFVGLVRDFSEDSYIKTMTLEHYPGMTEKQLKSIENEACQRWPLDDSLIIHRYGILKPGENIVLVVTASAHRKAAFEACEFLIDWLKTKAPFWKKEETEKGTKWVEAKIADDQAANQWQE